jgi:magnesium-transporting ATPase (P-type)
MSTVIKGANGSNVVLLKGAPERILEKCNGVVNSNDQVVAFKSDNEKKELLNKIKQEASQGFRVLGIAIAKDGGKMKHINEKNIE